MLPICLNLINPLLVLMAVWRHSRNSSLRQVLHYFTALSNLLCGAGCLAVTVCRIAGPVPQGVLALKYVGTVSVTVTMLTVLVFLGPTIGYRKLMSGPDLHLHLVCPMLALITYLIWDKPRLSFGPGMLPVAAYGALYLKKVLYTQGDGKWGDFYGFNRGGKWPLSLALMLLGTFLLSTVLWKL